MSLKIEFNYEGEDYVLEYSRDAIKYMEQKGFSLEKFSDAPATMMDIAFEALFFKNHKKISMGKIKEIYGKMGNKKELMNDIWNMVSDSYNELFDDSEGEGEGEGKNISWKTV